MTETWREAIKRACDGVPAAEAERERVLQAAMGAGLTVRTIASALDRVSGSTVWRWAGGKNDAADTRPSGLDQPAVILAQEEAPECGSKRALDQIVKVRDVA